MPPRHEALWADITRRYGLAVVATVAAAIVRWELRGPFDASFPFVTFFPAVAIVAIAGGAGPGILATLLSTLAVWVWFVEASAPAGATLAGEVVGTALFCAGGVLVSVVAQMLHRSRQREHDLRSRQREELVRTEESLRASEEFNRRVFASTYDCMKVVDLEGNLLAMGEGGRRIMEIDDVELYLHKPYLNFWKEEDWPKVQEALGAAMAGGVGSFEGYSPSVTGKPRWWDVRVTPIRGADGRPERLLVIARDCTEAKLAEEAVRRSEALYRAIARNIPGGGVCVVDRDLRCLALEGSLTTLACQVGMLREGPDGRSLREVLGETLLNLAEPRFRRALAGETDSYESEFQTPLGRRVTFAQYLPLRDERGQVVAAMVLVMDITQRKQMEEALRRSEEQFHQLADAMPHLGWTARPDGTLDYCNERVHQFEGFRQQDNTWEWSSALHPDDLERTVEAWQRALAICQVYQMEHRLRQADGQWRWHLTRAVPLCDEHGHVMKWFGTSTDIDDNKRAEQALRDSRQLLQEANQTLEQRVAERTAEVAWRAGQLQKLALELTQAEQKERQRLAHILHDHLQQLIVGTKMRMKALQNGLKDSPLQAPLQQAQDLLDESIDVSRSLAVDLSPPILHEVDFGHVLHWLAGWMHDKHGLTVHVDADGGIDPREEVRMLLFQAVRELLLNVAKHAKVSYANVELHRVDPGHISLVVADQGAGFDPARYFQPKAGAGFGLFSLRERLELLGGRMDVEAAPDRGCRMTLIVPLDEPAGRAEAAPPPAGGTPQGDDSR